MNLLTEKILLTIKENYIEAINKLSKESSLVSLSFNLYSSLDLSKYILFYC